MSEQPTEICDNCQKAVPQSKIATHFGYCRRNIKKCATCGQMYDINFVEDHQEQFHKMAQCKFCKKDVQPNDLKLHQSNCQSRTQFCQYCQLNVPLRDYNTHLKACESRTKNCEKCRKPVANIDYLVHTIECPGIIEEIPVQRPRKVEPTRQTNQYSSYQQYLRQNQKAAEVKPKVIERHQVKPTHNYTQEQPKKQYPSSQWVKKQKTSVSPHYSNSNNHNQTNNQKVSLKDQNRNGKSSGIGSNKEINRDQPYGIKKEANNGLTGANVYKHTYNHGSTSVQPHNSRQGATKPYSGISNKVNEPLKNQKKTSGVSSNPTNNQYSYNYQKPTDISSGIGLSGTGVRATGTTSKTTVNQQNYPSNTRNIPQQKQNNAMKKEPTYYSRPTQQSNKPTQFNKNQYKAYQNLQYQDLNNPVYQYNPPQSRLNHNYQNDIDPQISNLAGGLDEDQQMQKAIMASMGITQSTKKSTKMDDIPPEFLDDDMMNQSFYDKQAALMEEIQNKRKKR